MPKPVVQILVCVNERPPGAKKPSCGPRGGLELYRRFKDRVRELGLRDRVMVTRTGCLKHCSRGVAVAVQPYNYWYAGVRIGDVDEILAASVPRAGLPDDGAGGAEGAAPREVARLRMPDIPWE